MFARVQRYPWAFDSNQCSMVLFHVHCQSSANKPAVERRLISLVVLYRKTQNRALGSARVIRKSVQTRLPRHICTCSVVKSSRLYVDQRRHRKPFKSFIEKHLILVSNRGCQEKRKARSKLQIVRSSENVECHLTSVTEYRTDAFP